MNAGKLYLPLLFDAPLQSWGHGSRFSRRTTERFPTKSAVIGMLAAALGLDKDDADEPAAIQALALLSLKVIALPRSAHGGRTHPVLRMEDYHTVLGTRLASGKIDMDGRGQLKTQLTHRQYLMDARFGIILSAEAVWQLPDGRDFSSLRDHLANPVWGVWFGRKCCAPALPLLCGKVGSCGPFASEDEAWVALADVARLGDASVSNFETWEEAPADTFTTLVLRDSPVTFRTANQHASRSINHSAPGTAADAMFDSLTRPSGF